MAQTDPGPRLSQPAEALCSCTRRRSSQRAQFQIYNETPRPHLRKHRSTGTPDSGQVWGDLEYVRVQEI